MRLLTDKDSEHTILSEAWTWEIVGFNLQREPGDDSEPFIDLTLRRGDQRRVFRFFSPCDVQIEKGGPRMTSGLSIVDVGARGLENLGVCVCDFEGSGGAVTFWARDVEERR